MKLKGLLTQKTPADVDEHVHGNSATSRVSRSSLRRLPAGRAVDARSGLRAGPRDCRRSEGRRGACAQRGLTCFLDRGSPHAMDAPDSLLHPVSTLFHTTWPSVRKLRLVADLSEVARGHSICKLSWQFFLLFGRELLLSQHCLRGLDSSAKL